jgi:hypothetical protein
VLIFIFLQDNLNNQLMKKIISMAFVMAVLFSSCSRDAVTPDESGRDAVTSKSIVVSPQAERLFGRISSTMDDIRGRDCKGGLGLCTPKTESEFTFDLRVFQSPFDVLTPVFDAATDKVTVIAAEEGNTINFYFPKDVVNSVNRVASDFDFFEVGQDVIAAHYQLVPGAYAKRIEGDYFVYKVQFTKI